MPKYDYKCDQEHIFEISHKISEKPDIVCPECGSTQTKKYLGNVSVATIFKGTGFAKNDLAADKMGIPANVRKVAEEKGVF